MKPVLSRRAGSRIRRTLVSAVALAAVGAVLAACGSSAASGESSNSTSTAPASSEPSSPSSASDGSTSAGSSSPGSAASSSSADSGDTVAAAAAALKALEASPPLDASALGPAFDTSALKGKTVYYIPIAQKVAHFPMVIANLKAALGTVGVDLHVCDGQGTPTGISSCLQQAIAAKPAAVITDYIPYQMMPTAMDQVKAAKIPLLIAGADAPEGVQTSDTFTFGGANMWGFPLMDGAVDAVTAGSAGKANLLFLKVIDSTSTQDAGDYAIAQFAAKCPGCTVTVKETSLAQMKNLSSLVSSAILSDPSIDYVVPQYDTYLSGAIQGLQSSGKQASVKLVTTGAVLATVQQVKTNPQLIAVAGVNPPYLAWAEADSVLRMMAGQPVPAKYPTLTRAFTKENIGDVDLSAASDSGAWFGDPSGYESAFKKIWGVN